MTQKVTALKCLFGLMSLAMIAVTVKTSLQVNLLDVLPGMVHDPWTRATFIDFYFNILIIWSWVVYKENHMARSLLWLAAFIALGSIATSFYVFLQLHRWDPDQPFETVFLRAK